MGERNDSDSGPAPAEGRSWWDRAPAETCGVCAGAFDLAAEARCKECNAPVCACCFLEVEGAEGVLCLDCAVR